MPSLDMTIKCLFCERNKQENGRRFWESDLWIVSPQGTFKVTVCRNCRRRNHSLDEVYTKVGLIVSPPKG